MTFGQGPAGGKQLELAPEHRPTVRDKLRGLLVARSDLTTGEIARRIGTAPHTARSELRALGAVAHRLPRSGKKVWRLPAVPADDLSDPDLENARHFRVEEIVSEPRSRPCRCEQPLMFIDSRDEATCARYGREVS